jgi:hypothetical protein
MKLLLGGAAVKSIENIILAVAVSLAILIGVCISLDSIGVAIGRQSVALSLAAVEIIIASGSFVFALGHDGKHVISNAMSVGDGLQPEGAYLVEGNSAKWPIQVGRVIAVGLGVISIAASIAIVHALAPVPINPRFEALSFSGGIKSVSTIESLKPGPTVLRVTVSGGGSGSTLVTGVLVPYVDGKEAGAPVRVQGKRSQTVAVMATVPPLNQCQNRLSVIFRPSNSSAILRVIRYIRAPGPCTDDGSATPK